MKGIERSHILTLHLSRFKISYRVENGTKTDVMAWI